MDTLGDSLGNNYLVRQEGRGEGRHLLVLNGMRWLLKRWWLWAGAGFMLLAVAAGYLLIPVEQSRITQENDDKILMGWSEKQVEDLLGPCAVSDVASGVVRIGLISGRRLPLPRDVIKIWSDDDGNLISVRFESGCVTFKHFAASRLSFWEKMKDRVQRPLKAVWP